LGGKKTQGHITVIGGRKTGGIRSNAHSAHERENGKDRDCYREEAVRKKKRGRGWREYQTSELGKHFCQGLGLIEERESSAAK